MLPAKPAAAAATHSPPPAEWCALAALTAANRCPILPPTAVVAAVEAGCTNASSGTAFCSILAHAVAMHDGCRSTTTTKPEAHRHSLL